MLNSNFEHKFAVLNEELRERFSKISCPACPDVKCSDVKSPGSAPAEDISSISNCLMHGGKQCFREMIHETWLETLDNLATKSNDELHLFDIPIRNAETFDLWPVSHECDANHLVRVGTGDGGKWICGPLKLDPSDCIVFSLGSAGIFNFEQEFQKMFEGRCQMHTFDCTGSWSDPSTTFHQWCIGGEDEVLDGKVFKKLSTILKELNLPHITLLKMDIESYEWKVIPDMFRDSPIAFPQQILFELHTEQLPELYKLAGVKEDFKNWLAPMVRLAHEIDDAGYRIAFKEVNTATMYSAEIILVHKDTM